MTDTTAELIARRRAPPRLAPVRKAAGAVALMSLECPAPEAWGSADRTQFLKVLARLNRTRGISAIVLTGPRIFCDIGDDAAGRAGGAFDPLLDAVAASPIPVIAAIAGDAIGSGLELALACSARVAAPTSSFALPGITGGRLPRGSALARLTDLIGVEASAGLVAFGERLDARQAVDLGLVDAHAADDLIADASALALRTPIGRRPLPQDAVHAEAHMFSVRLRLRREAAGQSAPLAAIRALEAAVRMPRRRLAAEVERIAAEFSRTDQGVALQYAARGAAALASAHRDADDLCRLAFQLRWPMVREACHLIDEGATPAQVDRCLEAYGFIEGPFAQSDRLGLANVFAPVRGAAPTGLDWVSYSPTLDLMADAGRHGGAEGLGWYRGAGDGSDVRFDSGVDQLIRASAVCQRLHRAPLDDETVLARCVRAAIAGAEAAVGRDQGLTAVEVDALWTGQLGFPRWRGGPLHQADQMGLRPRTEAKSTRRVQEKRFRPTIARTG